MQRVNNSTEVLDRLHQINKTSRARHFDSNDFATLYTNIPHNALKNNIRSLVREAFKIRGAKYIIVDRSGNGHWSLESALNTAYVSVTKSKLVEWTEYLIDNVYTFIKLNYIIVDRSGNGHWSLESALNTAYVSVTKSKLVEWTEYLIDNVYTFIKVGNNMYRQTIKYLV